jgi:D-glycero-alpha-D-manno-heptose-7-phosphate kinase
MKDMVEEAIALLNSRNDICGFGRLLREAWEAKRSLSAKVSNKLTDEIYDAALEAGALGGKLTGAGGGGFMLLFVPPGKQKKVREKLNRLLYMPFTFESGGSQVIFFEPEKDYSFYEKLRSRQSLSAFQELSDLP